MIITEYQGLYLDLLVLEHMMDALANRLSENGVETTLVNVPTYGEIKQLLRQAVEAVVLIKNTPILVLDDIGAEMNNCMVLEMKVMVIFTAPYILNYQRSSHQLRLIS